MAKIDNNFFKRADEHIHLSNEQLSTASRGKVSASMMYSVARFNAWISACGFDNSKQMNEAKEETIEYFVKEYAKMLRENFEDYIENFDEYMKPKWNEN
ncbi:MAG: DUF3144 domain-containing protein [Bacteroidota bacterium]